MATGQKEKSEPRGKHTPLAISEKLEELDQRLRKVECYIHILKSSTTGAEFDTEVI
jgi:hypothetical protein